MCSHRNAVFWLQCGSMHVLHAFLATVPLTIRSSIFGWVFSKHTRDAEKTKKSKTTTHTHTTQHNLIEAKRDHG